MTLASRLLLAATVAAASLLAACLGSDGDSDVRVIVDGTVLPSPTSTAATSTAVTPGPAQELLPVTAVSPISTIDPDDLRGFDYPLEGACLPDADLLMPNAPREYRNGTHEGIDWYDLSSCARVSAGTPVRAMYDGVVSRADLDYEDLTAATLGELEARTAECACSDPEVLDTFRGRQLWIDHGGGIVTRYAHLDSIAEGLYVGATVRRGQVIGIVGESGTPESITDPGTQFHLHAEVRVGDSFLGAGLPPDEVRRLYEQLFAPRPVTAE